LGCDLLGCDGVVARPDPDVEAGACTTAISCEVARPRTPIARLDLARRARTRFFRCLTRTETGAGPGCRTSSVLKGMSSGLKPIASGAERRAFTGPRNSTAARQR
jgi:hypothetical protein